MTTDNRTTLGIVDGQRTAVTTDLIRSGIYAVIAAISQIGTVYDYKRWAEDLDTFIHFFDFTDIGGSTYVKGWEVEHSSPVNEDSSSVRTHSYNIYGYRQWSDDTESEKLFSDDITSIQVAFRENQTINGNALGHDFIQVEELSKDMFGSVYCHFCKLTLTVYEHIAGE